MTAHRYSILALLVLLPISACKAENPVSGIVEDIDATSDSDLAKEFVRLINSARSQDRTCGDERFSAAAPVDWNESLTIAAGAHSRDMATNDLFSHTGSDGKNAGARIGETGYQPQTWGENIAAGYPSVSNVVQGWLDSPGHCANIMNPRFTEIGAAYAERTGTAYGIYWTLVLAAPR